MDDEEPEMFLQFTMEEKDDLTFNLVSPLNELILFCFNDDKLPKKYDQDA